METEVISTQPVEGNGAETPSQEIQAPEQSVPESQSTGITQVESNVNNKPQDPETTRRKPSDFYREREAIRNLKETNQRLSQKMDEMASLLKELKTPKSEVSDVPSKFDLDAFVADH